MKDDDKFLLWFFGIILAAILIGGYLYGRYDLEQRQLECKQEVTTNDTTHHQE